VNLQNSSKALNFSIQGFFDALPKNSEEYILCLKTWDYQNVSRRRQGAKMDNSFAAYAPLGEKNHMVSAQKK
jgi:hypothetical protein